MWKGAPINGDTSILLHPALKLLLVKHLQDICRCSNMRVGGRKDVLIERIFDRIETLKAMGGELAAHEILKRICYHMNMHLGRTYYLGNNLTIYERQFTISNTNVLSDIVGSPNATNAAGNAAGVDVGNIATPGSPYLLFGLTNKATGSLEKKKLMDYMSKLRSKNPFVQYVGTPLECFLYAGGDYLGMMNFNVAKEYLEGEEHDIRIYCYNCVGNELPSITNCSWPLNLEMYVNKEPIVKNWDTFKGSIKLRHTSRPSILRSHQKNVISVSFPNPAYNSGYVFVLRVVQLRTVDDVMKEVLLRQVKDKAASKEEDISLLTSSMSEGIAELSRIVSLLCPLVLSRVKTPARGLHCTHLQCFDLRNFLSFNYRSGTWRCPVCNDPVTARDIIVDGYMAEILESTAAETEDVVFTKDGWTTSQGLGGDTQREVIADADAVAESGDTGPQKKRRLDDGSAIPSIRFRLEGTDEYPILID